MAITKDGCPECNGQDPHCPACDGTNYVYITSADGNMHKEEIHANYWQTLEDIQRTTEKRVTEIKLSREFYRSEGVPFPDYESGQLSVWLVIRSILQERNI